MAACRLGINKKLAGADVANWELRGANFIWKSMPRTVHTPCWPRNQVETKEHFCGNGSATAHTSQSPSRWMGSLLTNKNLSNKRAANLRPPREFFVPAFHLRQVRPALLGNDVVVSLPIQNRPRPSKPSSFIIQLVVCCAMLAVLWQHRLPIYVAFAILVHEITLIVIKWSNYFANQTDFIVARRQRHGLLRMLDRHSDLVVNGHYMRRVFTGYFLYNLTQPGKTFLNSSVRHRTRNMNESFISELSGRHRRRLSSIRIVSRNDDDN